MHRQGHNALRIPRRVQLDSYAEHPVSEHIDTEAKVLTAESHIRNAPAETVLRLDNNGLAVGGCCSALPEESTNYPWNVGDVPRAPRIIGEVQMTGRRTRCYLKLSVLLASGA